jgi:hypothetical protein
MPSKRFKSLREQLTILETHLLPAEYASTGIYENESEVFVRALAYRILAHAEIEAYLEERAEEIAQEALLGWQRSKYVSRVTLCLMGFSGREMKAPANSIVPPSRNKASDWPALLDIGEKLADCVSNYVRFLRIENHGIRESNILSILLPVGILPSQFDPQFLIDMENFGRRRGVAAHSSTSTPHVKQGFDPRLEQEQVAKILVHLENIDDALDRLLGDARWAGENVLSPAVEEADSGEARADTMAHSL